MGDGDHNKTKPGLVSVVMPCYNRAKFLPEAVGAIRGQTYTDWELVVVDDGSTDETKQVLDSLTRDLADRVRYVKQDNGGAYAARNTGIDHARGEYLALYDSDDLWLPHHLEDCVKVLVDDPAVSWVYAAARKVDMESGREWCDNHFREGGRPHPMLALHTRQSGKARVFDDADTVRCGIEHNLCCLLQTGVIRASVFAGRRFVAHYRNEGEDELFPLRVMKAGHRIGYIDEVHLVYRAHAENASSVAVGISVEKRLRITAAAARGYEELAGDIGLTPEERNALRRRLANEYFWKRGYATLWPSGRRCEAMSEMTRGLGKWPWSLRMWKTWAVCAVKRLIRPRPAVCQ
ncbi:MAG: glycosyltransferase [Phycisphaera sp.]|nr:glycosyltransferase [Phycisphaera sp.]